MTGLAFMSAVLFLAVPVVVVVLLARALVARRGARPGDGRGVRRFFQYLLMLGLLVVTLVGLGRLLTLAVAGRGLVDPGADLAQGLTFAVVGGGLL
ncbi:MAG TPA: hypothetical protein PKB06_08300, partial [Actinotalea sp.]|nr:hypothetical protein [Actinotalea sp.]